MTLTLILTLTFGLLVWVDFFFRSGSAGNETATCALSIQPMPDRQSWSCKYELVDAIRVCSG